MKIKKISELLFESCCISIHFETVIQIAKFSIDIEAKRHQKSKRSNNEADACDGHMCDDKEQCRLYAKCDGVSEWCVSAERQSPLKQLKLII